MIQSCAVCLLCEVCDALMSRGVGGGFFSVNLQFTRLIVSMHQHLYFRPCFPVFVCFVPFKINKITAWHQTWTRDTNTLHHSLNHGDEQGLVDPHWPHTRKPTCVTSSGSAAVSHTVQRADKDKFTCRETHITRLLLSFSGCSTAVSCNNAVVGGRVPSSPSNFKSSWSHYSRLLVILCLWSGSWRELCFTVVQTMFSLLPQHLHQEPCGSWGAGG